MFRRRRLQFREATIEEKLHLSPFQKWKQYRIFPWKFFIHTFTWIFLTAQILIPVYFIDQKTTSYIENFDATFMPRFSNIVFLYIVLIIFHFITII